MPRGVGFIVLLAVGMFLCATCAQDSAPIAAKDTAGKSGEECVKPAKGPIGVPASETPRDGATPGHAGQVAPGARVGHPAPDFEAAAFVNGGFKNLNLSDYRGKWVALCFYPGDFTFV